MTLAIIFFTLYNNAYREKYLAMEPHPIPQNVTTFQFHLIGDMTLKQFIYLVVGSGIAYVLFVFVSPIYPLIAWPAIISSASSGFALAFLPINSRPLDSWIGAFLKAVYSPTKRVWKKEGKTFKEEPLFNSRLLTFTQGLQSSAPTPPPPPKPTVPSLPTSEELAKTVDLAKEAQALQMKIIQTERNLGQIKQASQAQGSIPVDYSEQVNAILAELQNLVSKASEIKSKIDTVTKPEAQAKPMEVVTPQAIKEKVKVVIPIKPKQSQLALTTFPNVISGVIKDRMNNYLEGVVAVIYDKEGLPVRALKTNKLGQFTGSTPLPNGVYTLELEKDNFTFDVLQIELGGEVLPPLMIASKN